MTDEAIRSELRAVLTMAADCEAAKQRAAQQQDWPRVEALEAELRKLWRAHTDLERQCAA